MNTETAPKIKKPSRLNLAITAGALTLAIFVSSYILGIMIGIPPYLSSLGIRPRVPESLYSIFTYSFGHASPDHLLMNMAQMIPLAVGIVFLRGWKEYAIVAILIGAFSGLFAWVFTGESAIIVGASGIVSGLAPYLAIKAANAKNYGIMLLGLLLTFLTALNLIESIGVVERVSWQAHLGGLIGGFLLSFVSLWRKEEEPQAQEVASVS